MTDQFRFRYKSSFICLFLCWISFYSFGINASVRYSTFKGIEQPNYIEIYIHVKGNSVSFEPTENLYQAEIAVKVEILQAEKVVKSDNYIIESPEVEYPERRGITILDLKRFQLENGNYELLITLRDKNNWEDQKQLKSAFEINYVSTETQISGIQLLDYFQPSKEKNRFVKHGYFLKPTPYSSFPSFVNDLPFFVEIYNTNTDLDEQFLIRYYIQDPKDPEVPLTSMLAFQKKTPSQVHLLLNSFDITELPHGNYQLVVEIRDKNNNPVKRKAIDFTRSNPLAGKTILDYEEANYKNSFVDSLSDEELRQSIGSITPIFNNLNLALLNGVLKGKDREKKKQFVYYYWALVNELTPIDPYQIYMDRVKKVNRLYSGAFGDGYSSDRGYIHLKYGPPDDVLIQDSEPQAPPYHIWTYFQLDNTQRNIKFIFYNPSLAGEGFTLLHSNARGEVNNPQWQRELYSRTYQPSDGKDQLEGTEVDRHFGGGRAGEFFNDW